VAMSPAMSSHSWSSVYFLLMVRVLFKWGQMKFIEMGNGI
jgi:hypothetical protein